MPGPAQGKRGGVSEYSTTRTWEATMSFALLLNTLITTMALGAPPGPCPEGQTRAPIGVVDGAVRTACRAIEEVETTQASTDAARYAAMEKEASPKVEDFRGGSAVIYISTGAAIVIIVLLILLI